MWSLGLDIQGDWTRHLKPNTRLDYGVALEAER